MTIAGLVLIIIGLLGFFWGSGYRFVVTAGTGGAVKQVSGEDRFIKWASLLISAAGLVVAIIALVKD